MDIRVKNEKTQIMRLLWTEFFPQANSPAADIPRLMANKDWIKQSLEFYGWVVDASKNLNVDLKYVDGGAILYIGGDTPCGLVSLDDSNGEFKLRFTYVDNRV